MIEEIQNLNSKKAFSVHQIKHLILIKLMMSVQRSKLKADSVQV